MARDSHPRIAHKVPGRLRIKLPNALSKDESKALLEDLKVSPEVRRATLRGTSLIVEHNDDDQVLTSLGGYLTKVFPGFQRWSDVLDADIAKAVADPWINKSLPVALLGFAVYTGIRTGAVFAGESAFALAYVGFDLYWKFQQENVIRKIEKGLSKQEKEKLES